MDKIFNTDVTDITSVGITTDASADSRAGMVRHLENLLSLAEDPTTVALSVTAVVQQTDNNMQLHNANLFTTGNGSFDSALLGWHNHVSEDVGKIFTGVVDQIIPALTTNDANIVVQIGADEFTLHDSTSGVPMYVGEDDDTDTNDED